MQKNRLRITRGAGELVLARPQSPWLMMVVMLLGSSVKTCPDIFVLLVYWTWRCDLQDRFAIQMEKRDGIVLEVNVTCSEFEGHRLLTAAWSPGIPSLRHSVLHCRQGYNFKAENTEGIGFPGLSDGLGEEGVSQAVGSS